MPRIDDYKQAKALAVQVLSKQPLDRMTRRAGFGPESDAAFRVPFLDRVYRVSHPDFDFVDIAGPGREVPLQEQVLILHYLMAETDASPLGNWIAYREIPGAAFYYGAFVKRAVEPLKKVYGNDIAGFQRASQQLEGVKIEEGDAGFEFRPLPRVPLRLILWVGDEEFAPEAGILFDTSVAESLGPEDAAWLASLLVYRLMALGK
jgi:hypothetical protein